MNLFILARGLVFARRARSCNLDVFQIRELLLKPVGCIGTRREAVHRINPILLNSSACGCFLLGRMEEQRLAR